ncbi:MAG: endonuclease III domain-containing protein [Aquificaceae bacterium]
MKLERLYRVLYELYGPQNWWPVDEEYHRAKGTDKKDEIVIGAILTQNTSWKNVEKALSNLKRGGDLSLEFIRQVNMEHLRNLIKPSGFYNQKAKRLKSIACFLKPTEKVRRVKREELLRVSGIGRETADVILLYAGERLSFVIDKYTQMFIGRFLKVEGDYDSLKDFFERSLPKDLELYKEFHALIDEHGKRYCKSTPLCGECPIKGECLSASLSS